MVSDAEIEVAQEAAELQMQRQIGRGRKAFYDCRPYEEMATDAECQGWEQARRETMTIGERIARMGRW